MSNARDDCIKFAIVGSPNPYVSYTYMQFQSAWRELEIYALVLPGGVPFGAIL